MAAGNAIIGALRAVLGIDTAQFETGLKSAQAHLSGFGAGAAKAGAAAAVAFAAAGAAVAVAVKGAIDNADKLNKASQKIGVPIEELSALKFAAELSDVSLDSLTKSMGKLSKAMTEAAAKPTSDAALAFRALGVSVTDSGGKLKSSSAILQDIAGKFEGLKDGAGKTAVSMAIFGKSGADLIPLLNSGKAGLQGMMEEAQQLGIVIDTKTGKAAEAFNDNLKRLGTVKDGIITKVTAGMLPALENLSKVMVDSAKNTALMDGAAKVLSVTLQALVSAVIGIGGALTGLGQTLWAVAGLMANIAKGEFTKGLETFKNEMAAVGSTAQTTATMIKNIWVESSAGYRRWHQDLDEGTKKQKDFNFALLGGKNAVDQFLISQQKSLASRQAELQADGLAAGAKERLKVILEGYAIAAANGTVVTEAQRLKLIETANAAELLGLKLGNISLIGQTNPFLALQVNLDATNAKLAEGGLKVQEYGMLTQQAGQLQQKIWMMSADSVGSSMESIGNSLGSMSNNWARLAKIGQAIGAAVAFINSYIAASNAFATAPFPANVAIAAGVLAKGIAMVAAIKGAAVPAGKFATGGAITVPGGMGGGDKVRAMVDLEAGEQLDIWRPDNGGRDPRRGGDVREVTINIDGAWRPFMEAMIPQLNSALGDGHRLRLAPV